MVSVTRSIAGLLSVAALTASSAAWALDPSGIVVASLPSARADGVDGNRVLAARSVIFTGDRIVTTGEGEAQIKLSDGTRLVVGPKSTLVIDDFIYQSGRPQKLAINAVRGAFRFISGKGPKSAYTITTPTSTIGIRGTEFDVTVDANGGTNLALFSGEVDMCNAGRCITLRDTCSMARVDPRSRPREVDVVQERANLVRDTFPYIQNQSRLWREFRVSGTSSCMVRRARLPSRIDNFSTGSIAPARVQVVQSPPPPVIVGDPPVVEDPPTEATGDGNNGLGNGEGTPGSSEANNPGKADQAPGHNK